MLKKRKIYQTIARNQVKEIWQIFTKK